ncbi:MAG: molybdopterin-dependent oxidoreductase [Ilumatobacteraceae bacterium]
MIDTPHVYAQMGDGLPVGMLAMPRATIDDTAAASTIVLLGPDLKEELPVLYLRYATRCRSVGCASSSSPCGRVVSRASRKSAVYEPGGQVEAVRRARRPRDRRPARGGPGGRDRRPVQPRRVVGRHGPGGADLLAGVPGATVLPAFRRGNVVGALQVGMRPRPGGLDTRGILQAAADGKIECLVLVGADPLADFPDTDLARRALAGARRIVSVDTHLSASAQHADVVLPAAAFGEKSGTTTNLEGRVTTLGRKVTAAGTSRPDWMIATAIARGLGTDLGFRSVDDVTDAIARMVDGYEGVTRDALADSADGVLSCRRRRSPRSTRRGRGAGAEQLRLPARRHPQALRRRGDGQQQPVARPPRTGPTCTSTRSTSNGSACNPAPTCGCRAAFRSRDAGRSRSDGAAGHGVDRVQPTGWQRR